jgi:hypothetical protein
VTALQDCFAALVDEHGPDATLPTEDLLSLVLELQLAAILLRDLTEAMPTSLRVSMPPALANRLYAGHYQDTLDSCVPDLLKPAVRELVVLDPDIIRAREDGAQ